MKTKIIPKTLGDLPFVFAVSQAEDPKMWGTTLKSNITTSLLEEWINQGRKYTTDGVTWHTFTKEVEEKESGEVKVWINIYKSNCRGPVMHLSRDALKNLYHGPKERGLTK